MDARTSSKTRPAFEQSANRLARAFNFQVQAPINVPPGGDPLTPENWRREEGTEKDPASCMIHRREDG